MPGAQVGPVEAQLTRGHVVQPAPRAFQEDAGAVRVSAAVVLQRDGQLDEPLEQDHPPLGPATPHHLERLVGVEVVARREQRQETGEGSGSGGRVAASIGKGFIDAPLRVHAICRLPVDCPSGWPRVTRAPWLTPGA